MNDWNGIALKAMTKMSWLLLVEDAQNIGMPQAMVDAIQAMADSVEFP